MSSRSESYDFNIDTKKFRLKSSYSIKLTLIANVDGPPPEEPAPTSFERLGFREVRRTVKGTLSNSVIEFVVVVTLGHDRIRSMMLRVAEPTR
jgi:hypothetical protein